MRRFSHQPGSERFVGRPVPKWYRERVCQHCINETERGWIEQDNNGPIVPCPVCNRDEKIKRG